MLSLIICTRNRHVSLRRTLETVSEAAKAAPAPVELIIVDNGSTDATSNVIAAFAAAAPFKTITLHEPRPGLARARNAGIAKASGAVIAFTDDDCWLSSDYFNELSALFPADGAPAIRGGLVLPGDPADLPFSIKIDKERQSLEPGGHPGAFIIGANMAVSKAVFDAAGGFDERFGAGAPFRAGEETEFIYRARRLGFPVEYVPAMPVLHFHGRKNRDEIGKLHHSYSIGTGALYAKYLFRSPKLLRYLYWSGGASLRELFGGPPFDPALNLSWRSLLIGNVHGMALYWGYGLAQFFSLPRWRPSSVGPELKA